MRHQILLLPTNTVMRHTIITPTSCTQHKRSNEASIALTELTVCASSCVQDHPPMWIIPLCLYLLMHWIIPLCLYFLCAESSPCVDHRPILLYIYPICTLPPSFPFFLFHRASSSSPLASPSLPYPSSHFCLLIAMSSICLALLLNFFSLSLSHRAPCP